MSNMRVVIATDGSVESDIAGAIVKRLPLPVDTDFKVAMVTHLPLVAAMPFGPEAGVVDGRAVADCYRIERQIAQQTVEKVAARLSAEGRNIEPLVLEGDTADQLLDLVLESRADLVLTGCGINSNFAAFFLGSVSRKLVLYSEASVVVGRHYADTAAEGSYNRISGKAKLDVLVAVDGTKGSDLAIQSLEQIKNAAFGNVYVASIESIPFAEFGMDPVAGIPNYESSLQELKRVAGRAAERISSCADNVEILTSFGRPSTQISHLAREKNVDLVMLGANRHGALERFLLGSCAYEVATGAPCSVLIFRDALPFEA
jgi:nucleotide-binding universal stress UspA family protein